MPVLESACLKRFVRLCADGFAQGWHEANGGNLSYRMREGDVAACADSFNFEKPWVEFGVRASNLGGAHLMVTGAGKFMRNVSLEPAECIGIVQLNETGTAWRTVWGLEGGGRPTSELPTHVMNHSVRMEATQGASRVIYHAHCPNIIALSTLLESNPRTWTRALWKCMTECVIVFPQGVGVVPWMVPGSAAIAQASAQLMAQYDAVVWTQHGMFVSGNSFDAAFGMMHTIEKAAGLYLAARQACGGAEPPYLISDEHLLAVAEAYGVQANREFLEA